MSEFASLDRRAAAQPENGLEREIHQLAARLHARFPDLPEVEIVTAVSSEYRKMGSVRVRDFLPVLVERRVRSRLNDLTPPR